MMIMEGGGGGGWICRRRVMPEDLMVEILKRLAVKRVGQCRCVCKSWNLIISSPLFSANHQSWIAASEKSCLLLSRGNIKYASCHEQYSSLISETPYGQFVSLNLEPFPFLSRLNLIDAIHSVVCLTTSLDDHPASSQTILWNPWIHKYVQIPPNPSLSNPFIDVYSHSLGLGFDSRTNDFKLIRLWNHINEMSWYYEVFSFVAGEGAWRSKAVAPPSIPPGGKAVSKAGFFMNGAIHWILEEKQKHDVDDDDQYYYMLLMFDCQHEEFTTMMLPPEFNPLGGDRASFDMFKSQRGLLTALVYLPRSCHLWVMEVYGVTFTRKKKPFTKLDRFDCFWLVSEQSMFLMDVNTQAVSYAAIKHHNNDNHNDNDDYDDGHPKVSYEICLKKKHTFPPLLN